MTDASLAPLLVGALWEALMGLGLGTQVVVAVVLSVVALELRRMVKVGARAGGMLSSIVLYAIIALVTVAVIIGVGWADPNIGAFTSDVQTWGGDMIRALLDRVPALNLG